MREYHATESYYILFFLLLTHLSKIAIGIIACNMKIDMFYIRYQLWVESVKDDVFLCSGWMFNRSVGRVVKVRDSHFLEQRLERVQTGVESTRTNDFTNLRAIFKNTTSF